MGGSNITLTLTQWQNKAFKITGVLTANVSLILPLSPNAIGGTPGVGGEFIVNNQTTGNFLLQVITAATGSGGVTVPQGARTLLYSDSVNVFYADDGLGVPIGAVMDFAGTTAPAGWLLCFGQSLLRAQYPNLFAIIGSIYGAVDGTHFSLPDYRGRILAGKDDMGGVAAGRIGTVVTDNGTIIGTTLASTGGSSTHTQATGEVGVHSHSITEPNGGQGHQHNFTAGFATGQSAFSSGIGQCANSNSVTAFAVTGITINNTPAASAMAWLQPTMIANKIIFAGV